MDGVLVEFWLILRQFIKDLLVIFRSILDDFLVEFWMILGQFWMIFRSIFWLDFWLILDRFLKDLLVSFG